MMYAYTTFHAFSDGNKRTALMSTSFFFHLNHYYLVITDDAPEFTRDFATTCLDKPHVAIDEIRKTADWLRPKIVPLPSGFGRGILSFLMILNPLEDSGWETFFGPWLDDTRRRFLSLKKENGPATGNLQP